MEGVRIFLGAFALGLLLSLLHICNAATSCVAHAEESGTLPADTFELQPGDIPAPASRPPVSVPLTLEYVPLRGPPDFTDGYARHPAVCISAVSKKKAFCTLPPKDLRPGWHLLECQPSNKKGDQDCFYQVRVGLETSGEWRGLIKVTRAGCKGLFYPVEMRLWPADDDAQRPLSTGEEASK